MAILRLAQPPSPPGRRERGIPAANRLNLYSKVAA
ncbi:hypothetical protein ACVW0Q_000864 [Thermostichus sp. MS-CIW-21]|nr:hypothetical protein CYA_2133 [Synechococcus sp. JA-3-3Ab]